MALTSLFIFLGGGFGALSRFFLTKFSMTMFKTSLWGTLFVNIIGALILYLVSQKLQLTKKEIDFGIKIGFLGGLTTFSTMSYECFTLIQNQKMALALGYLGLNIVFGIIVLVLVFR